MRNNVTARILLPLLFLLLALAVSCAKPSKRLLPTVGGSYAIGSARIASLMHQREGSSLLFFNMHDDENTAVEAALRVIREYGGRVLELRHSGKRLIEFNLEGNQQAVDPNRIFTDSGAKASLERYGTYTEAGFQSVRQFADQILDRYPFAESSVIITVHNNSKDAYSLLSYTSGGEYEVDAAATHLQPGTDPDDFFFVTDRYFFDALSAKGYNVVLQDNTNVTDDGSLSVLAARRQIPYINVEAQHGHRRQQAKMIREVYRVLETWAESQSGNPGGSL